ncbi:rhomboid family intramembrane serine protease [soil metagenome]
MSQQFRPSSFQILPPVVKNLLIINGIFYLATVVLQEKYGIDLADYLGLHFPSSPYFRPHQFITHLFMHGSLMHIFSNMFALWMFGNILENVWGPKRFLTYYLVTGVGAALIHTLFTWYEIEQVKGALEQLYASMNPVDFKMFVLKYQGYLSSGQDVEFNELFNAWRQLPSDPVYIQHAGTFAETMLQNKVDVATVGASGAVFGVLLAFGMLFPNTIIYLYFAIPVKAKYFVMFYGLFELYSGIQNNPADNVAHYAHLGGMLFGYILIRAWKNSYRRDL